MALPLPVPPPRPPRSLLRILGFGFGVAASLGATLGVGILRTPGLVATQLPDPAWIIAAWAAGGAFALLGTLCVIELGTSLPQAGGWYHYTRTAFGDLPGFVVGWTSWLTWCLALGYASIALGEYLAVLVPALGPLGRARGMLVLLVFLLIQLAGLRPVSRFQELTGLLKGLILLTLVGACFWFAPHRPVGAPPPGAAGPGLLSLSALVIAMQAIVKTYDGWQTPASFTEEDRNPNRNLPRAMLSGTAIIILIYVGFNVALLSILRVPEIAASPLPAAAAFARLFDPVTGTIITGLAILSIAGLLNTIFLAAPRVLFAMARNGLFFHRATEVNRRGVPVFAVAFSGAAGLAVLFIGSFQRIYAIAAILAVLGYAAGYASLFALRRRFPDLPRPFRVWGYPAVPLLALAGAILFLVGSAAADPIGSLWTLLLVGLSLPAYGLLRARSRRTDPTP